MQSGSHIGQSFEIVLFDTSIVSGVGTLTIGHWPNTNCRKKENKDKIRLWRVSLPSYLLKFAQRRGARVESPLPVLLEKCILLRQKIIMLLSTTELIASYACMKPSLVHGLWNNQKGGLAMIAGYVTLSLALLLSHDHDCSRCHTAFGTRVGVGRGWDQHGQWRAIRASRARHPTNQRPAWRAFWGAADSSVWRLLSVRRSSIL